MCSYSGEEIVGIARLIANKQTDLQELIRDARQEQRETLNYSEVHDARAVLIRAKDQRALEVLDWAIASSKEVANDPVRVSVD